MQNTRIKIKGFIARARGLKEDTRIKRGEGVERTTGWD